jgi:hypothetical protein
VCQYGYEVPIAEAFQAKTGRNPLEIPNADDDWIRFRASFNTLMLREIREEVATQPQFDVSALVFPPAVLDDQGQMYATGDGLTNSALNTPPGIQGNLHGALLDVAAWGREGLVDGIAPMISPFYNTTGTWRSRPEALGPEGSALREQIGREVGLRIAAYCYGTDPDHLQAIFQEAHALEAEELILFESTPLQMGGHTMGGGMWPTLARLTDEYGTS